MGTTRKKLADQTKVDILTVARQLFLSQGYQGTSTRQIAEKCGITQPNLYHHFGNKQSLFKNVIEDLIAEIEETQTQIVAKTLSPKEKLTEMMAALLAAHPANFFGMMADIKTQLSEEDPQEVYQLYNKAYLQPFMTVFDELDLRAGLTAKEATTHLMYHLGAMMSISRHYNKEQNLEQLNQTVDLLLYGLVSL